MAAQEPLGSQKHAAASNTMTILTVLATATVFDFDGLHTASEEILIWNIYLIIWIVMKLDLIVNMKREANDNVDSLMDYYFQL